MISFTKKIKKENRKKTKRYSISEVKTVEKLDKKRYLILFP